MSNFCAAQGCDFSGLQSPVMAHIEMVKVMIRSGQLPKPSEEPMQPDADLPEMLDTPKCSQMVTEIHGSFKAAGSAQHEPPGGGHPQ